jgi:hypothetical protein
LDFEKQLLNTTNMNIGQSAIAGIMARAKMGRPRIGSQRYNLVLPDTATRAIDERRRLSGETRNQAIVALIDAGIERWSPHFLDRQGAIALLRASVRAKLLATDDPHERKVAGNTLISLDWIEEYLGLEKAEGGAK